jgi:hypothetical protein
VTGVAGESVNAALLVLWGCVVRPGFCKLLQCVGVFESYIHFCILEKVCDFPAMVKVCSGEE